MINTIKIKDNKIFLQLFKKGSFISDKTCVVYFRKNNLNCNRLGITTGKKTGCAVKRSRCRRIIRAAYYENEKLLPVGYDYVFVSRAYTCGCKSTDISEFISKRLVNRIKSGKFNNCSNSAAKKFEKKNKQ